MALRRSASRTPLALAFFIVLSGACGGDDDDRGSSDPPPAGETVPGPNVPQPPAQRNLSAEGSIAITPETGTATSSTLLETVESAGFHQGRKSGYTLEGACGTTAIDVQISLFFERGSEVLVVERRANRWTVERRSAQVVPSEPSSTVVDAGAADDSGDVADAEVVGGVGFPDPEGRRVVVVSLLADGVRYDIRATIPWLSSNGPATCFQSKPSPNTTSSSGSGSNGGGGCGGGGGSRRSSGGDWD